MKTFKRSLFLFGVFCFTTQLHAKDLNVKTLSSSPELLQLTAGILKSAAIKDKELNQDANAKKCIIQLLYTPNYIHERLSFTLAKTSKENLQIIEDLDQYLKTESGKVLFKSLKASLPIELKKEQGKTLTDKELETARTYLEQANLNQANSENLNFFAKQLMTTNAVDLTNKYLAKQPTPCSKLNIVVKNDGKKSN